MAVKPVLPYFEKEINCPVCNKKVTHHFLRDRQFIIQKRDEDQYPLEIEWYNPKFKKYNHLYFFMLYCPNCHFADERLAYLNPHKYYDSQKFSILRTVHRERYSHDPFIKLMANYIKYPEVDYTSAINIHLLAIYAQLGPGDEQYRDKEKLARYLHRLSWLFRENVYEGQYTEKEEVINEFTILHDNYQSAFLNSLSSFENLKEWWNDEIQAEQNGEREKTLADFQMEIKLVEKEISRLLDHLLLNNPRIYEIITKFREKYIKTNNLIVNQKYFDFTSFHAFLQQVKKEWPGAPVDEVSSLHQAAEYYFQLSLSDAYAGETLKQYNIFKIIIAIYARLKEKRKELEVINTAFKSAREFRQKAMSRLKIMAEQEDSPQHMIDHIKRSVRRIDEMVRRLQERRRVLVTALKKEDLIRAKKLLKKLPDNMSNEEKLNVLTEANLIDEVLEKYKEELGHKTILKKFFSKE